MAAPEPEYFWEPYIQGFAVRKALGQYPLMAVYPDRLRGSGWFTEPWSGEPPLNPPRFEFLQDAKTFCEVTIKLCG